MRQICRLCEPYITPAELKSVFGELSAEIASKYMEEGPHGRFRLRAPFAR